MDFDNMAQKAIVNRGNLYRLKKCMRKAADGGELTIGFLGGSITQGSLASREDTCYAYRVFDWWTKTFPQGEFTYVNGGIGGTTSQFGVARVEEDMLAFEPDCVIIEFSVNDEGDSFFEETYEGLIRRVYGYQSQPAIIILNNVRYDDGSNAQEQHNKTGKAYGLPCISMKDSIYSEVASGVIDKTTITPDDLHPNDEGHKLISDIVNYFLQRVYEKMDEEEEPNDTLKDPLTPNQYEESFRLQNHNSDPELQGFEKDSSPKSNIRDIFKKGWTADQVGQSIHFNIGECTGIAIQYRKSVKHPAPIAVVIVDGDEKQSILLDANFKETWGDCLYIDTVGYHMDQKEHTVEIRIVEAEDNIAVPFYLVSVIISISTNLLHRRES